MIELQPVYDLGFQVHNTLKPLSFGILAAGTGVAWVVSHLKLAVPGRETVQSPFVVLLQALALAFVLLLTGKINTTVQHGFHGLSEAVGGRKATEKFLVEYSRALDKSIDEQNKSALEYVSEKVAGALSGIVMLLSSFVALLLLHVFDFVRALLFAILVAVSPLAIALAILPGSGVLGRWLTALFEIASWEVIASITTKMAAAASVAAIGTGVTWNWLGMVLSALLLCVSVALTPTIAARLVGQGFGAIGPSILGVAQRQGSVLAGALGSMGARGGDVARSVGGSIMPPKNIYRDDPSRKEPA